MDDSKNIPIVNWDTNEVLIVKSNPNYYGDGLDYKNIIAFINSKNYDNVDIILLRKDHILIIDESNYDKISDIYGYGYILGFRTKRIITDLTKNVVIHTISKIGRLTESMYDYYYNPYMHALSGERETVRLEKYIIHGDSGVYFKTYDQKVLFPDTNISFDMNDGDVLLFATDVYQNVCKAWKQYKKSSSNLILYKSYNLINKDNGENYNDADKISYGPHEYSKALKNIVGSYRTIPSIKYMNDMGTKKYANFTKQYMLDGTLVYPDDIDKIAKLSADTEYIIKLGMTSNSEGLKILTGDKLMKYIYEVEDSYFNIDMENGNENKCDCCNFTAIVQKNVDLYKRCSEYRFMVLWGKIIGIYYNTNNKKTERIVSLNDKIYKYVHKMIDVIQKEYGDDYFFARIDIVTECDDTIDNKYTSETVFDKDFDGGIYLNEIEPLGSGKKVESFPLIDNGQTCIGLTTSIATYIYDTIQTSLVKLVNNKDPTPDITVTTINYNYIDEKQTTLPPFLTLSSNGIGSIGDMLNNLVTKYGYKFELWYNRSGQRVKLEPTMTMVELWIQMIKYPHDLYGFTHN